MINQSDLLRVSEKRILVGRAIEDDDPEHIDHARDLLRADLEHLRVLIDMELAELEPAAEQREVVVMYGNRTAPPSLLASLDPLAWWQAQADAIGEPILILDCLDSVISGTVKCQRYWVVLSRASQWEKDHKLARVEPRVLPVASEGV